MVTEYRDIIRECTDFAKRNRSADKVTIFVNQACHYAGKICIFLLSVFIFCV